MRTSLGVGIVLFFLLVSFTTTAGTDGVYFDPRGRKITIHAPVERIIALGNYRLEAVKVLGASDKVVGIDTNSRELSAYYFPKLQQLPDVGTWQEPNHEVIAALHPDLVITSATPARITQLVTKLAPFGITVVGLDFYRDNHIKTEIDTPGRILEKEDRALEYIRWREGYEKMINDYVSGLDENEKPTIYMEWGQETGKTWGKGSSGDDMCIFAGGKNLAATAPEFPLMSMEWMVAHNPQAIVKCIRMAPNTIGWRDIGEAQKCVDEIKHRPGLKLTDAVKNNRVYVYSSEIAWGLDSIVAAAVWLKWFHPDSAIVPERIYREYMERFLGIHYPQDIIFAYPFQGGEIPDPQRNRNS